VTSLRLLGIALLAGLLAWSGWEARWQPQPEPAPAKTALQPAAGALAPPEFAPLGDFTVTLQRPLFYEDRRLPSAAQAAPEDQAELPTQPTGVSRLLAVTAIIVEDGQRSALLSVPGETGSIRLREGESAGGWRLVEIGEDQVTVEANGRLEQIPLRDYGAAPVPAPQAQQRPLPRRPPRRLPPNPTTTPE
jgi:general secretion pathway protein N